MGLQKRFKKHNEVNQTMEKAKTPNIIKRFFKKNKEAAELKKVYDDKYNKTYSEERKKFLEEKAEQDAKKKAKQEGGLKGFFKSLRNKQ